MPKAKTFHVVLASPDLSLVFLVPPSWYQFKLPFRIRGVRDVSLLAAGDACMRFDTCPRRDLQVLVSLEVAQCSGAHCSLAPCSACSCFPCLYVQHTVRKEFIAGEGVSSPLTPRGRQQQWWLKRTCR